MAPPRIHAVSAVTLATHDMARAVGFYRALGFELVSGGETRSFTSFAAGPGHLNLIAVPPETRWSATRPRLVSDAAVHHRSPTSRDSARHSA